jgi:hypothetical protein
VVRAIFLAGTRFPGPPQNHGKLPPKISLKETRTIDSKYSKYSTEQLEVILTHLADPDEKETVKVELSNRYYKHYLNIIANPEAHPQTSTPPAPEDTSPPADAADAGTDEPAAGPARFSEGIDGTSAEALSLADNLAGIAEVTPIQLNAPVSRQTAAEPAEKDKPVKKKFCFIATAAYGSPMAQEVVLLQGFRDQYLARRSLGEKFIQAYYHFGPSFARRVSQNNALKLLTRFLLFPIILLIKKLRASRYF